MKKEMMIGVILRIQDRQRQPVERRQPFAVREIFPQQRAPADVIITVPIAAADRIGLKLQKAHHQHDRGNAEDQIDQTDRLFGLETLTPRELFRCRPLGECWQFRAAD